MSNLSLKYFSIIVLLFTQQLQSTQEGHYFQPAAKMHAALAAHTATVLQDGNVLVVGGLGKLFFLPVAVNQAQIYDVKTNQWRVVKGKLNRGRLNHASILLPDGKVLVVGGIAQDRSSLSSVELFDPKTETFELIGNMVGKRNKPCLNLLANGSVFISGDMRDCEIFEKTDGGYQLRRIKSTTYSFHKDHATVTLKDGAVLLIGGRTTRMERFDPVTETFSRCDARCDSVIDDQAAVLLYDGRVFIAGGQMVYTMASVNRTWLYDPTHDALLPGPDLTIQQGDRAIPGAADIVAVDLFESHPQHQGKYILLCGGEYDPGKSSQPNTKKEKDTNLKFAKVYDAVENKFYDVGPMLKVRDEFQAVLLPPEKNQSRVFIMGGSGQTDNLQSTCEIFSWKPNFSFD